jgi:hypothetical protein
MKAALLLGLGIGLAAGGGWAAEMPGAMPAGDSAGVGAPTRLAPAPAPTGTAPLFAPSYALRPPPMASPTRYPMAVFNAYHPHWVVEVFGR